VANEKVYAPEKKVHASLATCIVQLQPLLLDDLLIFLCHNSSMSGHEIIEYADVGSDTVVAFEKNDSKKHEQEFVINIIMLE